MSDEQPIMLDEGSPWVEHLEIARAAAQAAGAIQLESYGTIEKFENKGEVDLLTDIDLASEKVIKDAIRRHYPDHEILAEESDLESSDSEFRWVIDPLDGTTNYTHAYPFFGPSIALLHKGEPVVGVMLIPKLEEEFTALKGEGAFLNGKPISVSGVKDPSHSLFCTGFPYDRKERPDHYLEIFRSFMKLGHGVRRAGAAAVDLCYVACGRIDGFWEERLQPWDVAAGSLIVREAGGMVSMFNGDKLDLYGDNIIASNGKIHQTMVDTIASVGGTR